MRSLIRQPFEDIVDDMMSLEGKEVFEGDYPVYIVLTDTQTIFSKLSKKLTGDPYNHVSVALDESLDNLYTFALTTKKRRFGGGFKHETREDLKGARFSLYQVEVSQEAHERIKEYIAELDDGIDETKYNHKTLINFLLNRNVFEMGEDAKSMICSHFVFVVFQEVGIELFKKKTPSMLKPYDFVKSRLLKFVRRGVF